MMKGRLWPHGYLRPPDEAVVWSGDGSTMVRVIFKDTEWQIPGNITVRELMTSLGLNPQSVLAVRDGRLVNNETRLGTEGEIRFISVVSGG